MIYQRRMSRRAAQVARSQLAVRLGLAIYSSLCAAILLRTAILIFQFPDTVWTARWIVLASYPIVLPFRLVPAANRAVLGGATLADVTALLVLFAIPLLLIGRRSRSTAG